jgi:hypothetical protein
MDAPLNSSALNAVSLCFIRRISQRRHVEPEEIPSAVGIKGVDAGCAIGDGGLRANVIENVIGTRPEDVERARRNPLRVSRKVEVHLDTHVGNPAAGKAWIMPSECSPNA